MYAYTLVPQTNVWETSFFTLKSYGFKNVYAFIWTLSQKAIPLTMIIITSIIIPYKIIRIAMIPTISVYILQIINIIRWDIMQVDELEITYVFIIIAICIVVIESLRKHLLKSLHLLDISKRIREEIKNANLNKNKNA